MAQITKDTGIIEAVQKHRRSSKSSSSTALAASAAWLLILKLSVRVPVLTASTSMPSLPTSTTASQKAVNKIKTATFWLSQPIENYRLRA